MFVDTSMFYAAADAGDRDNARAKRILESPERLVTSDHVLVEIVAPVCVAGRPRRRGALVGARAIGENFPDQDFSIVVEIVN